jgi:hypothetical protein
MDEKIRIKKVPPLFVIRATGALRNFLMSLGRRMFPPDYVMMEFASSFWVAKAIGVAADLGIADFLNKKPTSISELASLTQTHEPSLLRLMRVLCGNGIFRDTGGNIYCNTKLSEALMEESHSMKYFISHHLGENNWMFVGDMEKCIRTGENAIISRTGKEPFDFLKEYPEKSELFSRAMTDSNEMSLPLFLAAYPFGKYKKIIDIGGGHGYMISAIASIHPGMQCVVLDLPHVVPNAKLNFNKFGVEDRCRFVEGDFFGQIPESGDLYILKNILHDWDDETCIKILKNVGTVIHKNVRLLVIDAVVDDKNINSFGKVLDLQMLIGTTGGRERTSTEFTELFKMAGFTLTRIIDTATPFSFIEGKLA